jgi:hypothetical protein
MIRINLPSQYNYDDMADLLHDIANKIDNGHICGSDWSLEGDEETQTFEPYVPKVIDYPPLPENYSEAQLIDNAKKVYNDNSSKLEAVKYVKNVCGWGLKEAKDFCDEHL